MVVLCCVEVGLKLWVYDVVIVFDDYVFYVGCLLVSLYLVCNWVIRGSDVWWFVLVKCFGLLVGEIDWGWRFD